MYYLIKDHGWSYEPTEYYVGMDDNKPFFLTEQKTAKSFKQYEEADQYRKAMNLADLRCIQRSKEP